MNNPLDIHKQAFREEAQELLTELEHSLLEWEEQPDDMELVGRIFRAMHTIKGSGAMFGFDDIARFTHEVETALDLVREGRLAASPQLIDLTLAARDQINTMVRAVDGGDPIDGSKRQEIEQAFAALIRSVDSHMSRQSSLPGPDPHFEQAPSGRTTTYRIRFTPFEEIFLQGTNPLGLLNELRDMGRTEVIAHLDGIPPLEDYVHDACYTCWDIILTTSQGVDAIKDVFMFVEDNCRLSIDLIDDGGHFDQENSYQRLGEILLERGDIKHEDLIKALKKKPRLGEVLVDEGMVSSESVESALIEQQVVSAFREKRSQVSEVSSIRVPAGRLDKLVDLVGEMVTVQARLSQYAGRRVDEELRSVAEEVERLTAELRDNAMSTRMVPIGTLFGRFKRLVRDLSHELNKEMEMVLSGEDTELDKTVIERLNDPLVHLIRNSIDHGIESPEERKSAGKPAKGALMISAVHSGANVLIKIQDDGAGLNREAIRAKAIEKGLIPADADLSPKALNNLIFAPGFSTSKTVTGVSGRGVGMDVVKKNIESLKGSIEVESEKGAGTTITLKIPLTLAIIDGLLVSVDDGYFVIPVSTIEECVELTPMEIKRAKSKRMIIVRDVMVPYIRLRDRFELDGKHPEIEKIVIAKINSEAVGFVVDQVIGDHQTVIKSLGPVFKNVTDISGATILGDGSVALILDLQQIVRQTEDFEAKSIINGKR